MFIDSARRQPPSVRRAMFIDSARREHPPSVRRAMFIDSADDNTRPPSGGHVYRLGRREHPPSVRRAMFIDSADDNTRPPSGGPCAVQSTTLCKGNHTSPSWRRAASFHVVSINMALL